MRDMSIDTCLGEVADIVIGKTPPRNDPLYWTDDLSRPFCTIADMKAAQVVPTREGVTALAENEGRAKRVPRGSLLMSFKLTLGRIGFAGTDLFPNEAIAWLRPRRNSPLPEYLALWLSSLDLAQYAGRAVKGNTLNGPSLRAIPILLPPLAEQRRIVDLIAVVDAAIEAAEREREAAEQAMDIVCNELLTTFPSCRMTPVRQIAEPGGLIGGPFGSSLRTRDYRPSGVPVVNGSNHTTNGWYLQSPFQYLSPEKAEELRRNSARPRDIVATNQGTVGQVSLVPAGPFEHYVVSQRQLRLRARAESALAEYVLIALRSRQVQAELASQVIRTGVPHINLRIFGDLIVPLPDLSVQQEVVDLMAGFMAVVVSALSCKRHLQQLRAAILGNLLSGNHEIPDSYDELLSA